MNIFKLLSLATNVTAQVQAAMADKEITVREMYNIVDNTLKGYAGFGLDDIAIKVQKENGKTKVELVINNV